MPTLYFYFFLLYFSVACLTATYGVSIPLCKVEIAAFWNYKMRADCGSQKRVQCTSDLTRVGSNGGSPRLPQRQFLSNQNLLILFGGDEYSALRGIHSY